MIYFCAAETRAYTYLMGKGGGERKVQKNTKNWWLFALASSFSLHSLGFFLFTRLHICVAHLSCRVVSRMRHFGTFVQVSFFFSSAIRSFRFICNWANCKKNRVARLSRARTRESFAIESNQEFSTACSFVGHRARRRSVVDVRSSLSVLFFEIFSLRARKKKQPVYFFLRRATAISPHDIYFCNRPHSQPHHQSIWCAARMFVVEYFSPSSSRQRSSVAIDGDCSRVWERARMSIEKREKRSNANEEERRWRTHLKDAHMRWGRFMTISSWRWTLDDGLMMASESDNCVNHEALLVRLWLLGLLTTAVV